MTLSACGWCPELEQALCSFLPSRPDPGGGGRGGVLGLTPPHLPEGPVPVAAPAGVGGEPCCLGEAGGPAPGELAGVEGREPGGGLPLADWPGGPGWVSTRGEVVTTGETAG